MGRGTRWERGRRRRRRRGRRRRRWRAKGARIVTRGEQNDGV
jgi:hypothetical protein